MKRISLLILALAFVFVACEKEKEDVVIPVVNATQMAYVVNYGSYSGSKSDISIYNTETKEITHAAYKLANDVDFTSNIESMAIYKDIAYLMSNNGDKIDIIDAKTLKATVNPIATDITKPRYFVANENTAYISCWGNVDEWSVIANSYIAKIDLASKTVSKIMLPGGPEGLIIKDGQLYTGLCTTNKVAVIDLATEVISFITVPAVPQQFVEDGNGKIWTSLVSKYSTPFATDSLGLAMINPTDNTVEAKIDFAGIGSNGYIHISSDKKTIYMMGKEAWPGTAATINTVDVDSRTLNASALITGEKFYGFNVNPANEDVYVLISPSTTEAGSLKIYDKTGTLMDEEETGVGPNKVVFYNVEEE